MRDVIEVSYTGDLLAHRRCARAWSYESHAGFHPYEQVQAMEGRLVHHAMEWLARAFVEKYARKRHATREELETQLQSYFRVLWARGIRTTFSSKAEVIGRVAENLFPSGKIDRTVKAVIEGAKHTEYELRSVRKLMAAPPGMKQKVLLTGVLDLVVQQQEPLVYGSSFVWSDPTRLVGKREPKQVAARPDDVEIWDYKGTRAKTQYLEDYVRQLLTYTHLYHERTGEMPARCVLFFINEPASRPERLLAIEVNQTVVDKAVEWTHAQVRDLQTTIGKFQTGPSNVSGGERELQNKPRGQRVSSDLAQQCTACARRFDCDEYRAHLERAGGSLRDLDLNDIFKN